MVCRCLCGADRSERGISSTIAFTGVSTSCRDRTGGLRAGGTADANAAFTVRRDTRGGAPAPVPTPTDPPADQHGCARIIRYALRTTRPPDMTGKKLNALNLPNRARSGERHPRVSASLAHRRCAPSHGASYAGPARPMRLPSGSANWATTSAPPGTRSGPMARVPPNRSASCSAAPTSGTPT